MYILKISIYYWYLLSIKKDKTYFGFIRKALRMKSMATAETPLNNLSGNVKEH